jgi:hypothetical protein
VRMLISTPSEIVRGGHPARSRLRRTAQPGPWDSQLEGATVWQELVRMAVTWGVMAGLVAFFYWMMSNIGTF